MPKDENNHTLFVRKLPIETTVDDLKNLFKDHGELISCKLKGTKQKPCGVVCIRNVPNIESLTGKPAKHKLHGKFVEIRAIKNGPGAVPNDGEEDERRDEDQRQLDKLGLLLEENRANLRLAGNLDDQIILVSANLALSRLDIVARQNLKLKLTQLFRPFLPYCNVNVFGSSYTGLGILGCDMDIYLDVGHGLNGYNSRYLESASSVTSRDLDALWKIGVNGQVHSVHPASGRLSRMSPGDLIEKFTYILRRYSRVEQIVPIPHASCPIVKFFDPMAEVDVDLSCKNALGVKNSELIELYIALDRRVRPLMFFVRLWMKNLKLSGPGNQPVFTSYTVILLVIFFLQTTSPPVIPTVNTLMHISPRRYVIDGWDCGFCNDPSVIGSSNNTTRLGRLLHQFMSFYANFSFRHFAVCPRNGIQVDRMYLNQNFPARQGPRSAFSPQRQVCVQEPFTLDRNTACMVNSETLSSFRRALQKAEIVLAMELGSSSKKNENQDWGIIELLMKTASDK